MKTLIQRIDASQVRYTHAHSQGGKDSHFFDRKTMQFFASKCHGGYCVTKDLETQTILFYTSEKACFQDPTRVYTVRSLDPVSGRIVRVSELGQFSGAREASAWMKRKARSLYQEV